MQKKRLIFYFDVTPDMELDGFHLAATVAGDLEPGAVRYAMTIEVDRVLTKKPSLADMPPTNAVIWRPIDDSCNYRPDAESTVLIYDGYLDDVVIGYLDAEDDKEIWYDQATGDPLPDPQMWSDVPFPDVLGAK